MTFDISDYDEITIYITDGWREWYIPKFRLTWTVDEPYITLYWTDTEKGTAGIRRTLEMDYQDVAFGYISPSSAGEIGIELGYYIISAWTDITGSVVDSVTDDGGGVVSVNNSDPENPIVGFDGVYVGSGISGDGTSGNPLISTAGGYTVINVSTTPYTVIPVTGQIIYNVDTTAFAITMNFPTAVGNTAAYTVNNRGANSVIIDPFGAQTINGNANQTLLFQNTSVDIYTDNSNLFIR